MEKVAHPLDILDSTRETSRVSSLLLPWPISRPRHSPFSCLLPSLDSIRLPSPVSRLSSTVSCLSSSSLFRLSSLVAAPSVCPTLRSCISTLSGSEPTLLVQDKLLFLSDSMERQICLTFYVVMFLHWFSNRWF